MLVHWLSAALLAWSPFSFGQNTSANASTNLDFGPVVFAGYNNYVYRDNVTSAQVVLTNTGNATAPVRFIAAFPDGNTGVLTYFVPLNGSTQLFGGAVNQTSLTSYEGADNQTGLQGDLSFSADFSLGVTLIGSVRTLRDYTEGSGLTHEIFNYTLGPYTNSSVTLVRHWINGTTVQYLTLNATSNAAFTVTPSSNVTLPPSIVAVRPDQTSNATIRFTTSFNFTGTTPSTPYIPLDGLGGSSLFLNTAPANGTQNLASVLNAIKINGTAVANEVAFLAYSEKFLAGGWRFLTYFGRDTLLTLQLLLPVFSQTSAEAILGAVLERVNTTGEVCHEETIGDYASFVNINNNQSQLGNTPSYSYIMVDTDFLLLPPLADYFLSTPQGQGRAPAFLNRTSSLRNGTFQSLLLQNVDHVLNLSMPFALNPAASNLVQIRDALVGDWRDSGTGLGYGKYPFDVNVALVPAALRAIAALSQAGILPSNYTNVTSYAATWEQNAYRFFNVSISPSAAQSSLQNYVQAANLSSALLYGPGSLNGTLGSLTNGTGASSTSPGFADSAQVIGGGSDNSTFFALSLKNDTTPVEVLNSDLGFVLLYGNNVSEPIITATVEALQPYPRGLLTNVGMVVANAAYDTNTTNIETFNYQQYHGSVVWSWQQALMASGISKQLGLCGLSNSTQLQANLMGTRPSWCSNTNLTSALMQAQTRLWDSIAGSSSAIFSEVYTPLFSAANNTFSIGDLGAVSPTGTEGDGLQLWAYGFLGEIDPRTGSPVANGFA